MPQNDMQADVGPEIPKFGDFGKEQRVVPEIGAPSIKFGDQPEEKSLAEWEATPKMEVAKQAAASFVPSAISAVKAIPEAIINYEQTGQALKQIGTGLASKAKGYMPGAVQDPEQKAQDEMLINAMLEPYQSVGGFKKALATDPFSVLTTATLPLTMGGSGLVKAGEVVGKTSATAGKLLTGAGKAAELASYATDPVKATMGATKLGYDYVGKPLVKKLAESSSGVPTGSMELAYKAGKEGTAPIRDSFNAFAKGQGDPIEFSRANANALKQWRADQIAEWASDKQKYMQQMTADVPLKPIFDAINQQRSQLTSSALSVGPHRQANAILDALEKRFQTIDNLPSGNPAKRIVGLDKIKQDLYDLAQKQNVRASQNAVYGVHAGVLDAIDKISPEYASIMGNYQKILDGTQNITKTLGVSDRVAANSEMAKFLMQQRNPNGQLLIEQLAKYDPRIPYMVAGASIHNALGAPSNWARPLTETAGLIWSFAMHPLAAATWASSVIAGRTLGSPEAVSKIPYLAGRISGSPVGAVGRATGTAAELGREAATGTLTREKAAEEELLNQGYRPLTIRPNRATGGRITAEGLLSAAERAKKEVNKTTEPLLNHDDSTVARALEVANRNIEG